MRRISRISTIAFVIMAMAFVTAGISFAADSDAQATQKDVKQVKSSEMIQPDATIDPKTVEVAKKQATKVSDMKANAEFPMTVNRATTMNTITGGYTTTMESSLESPLYVAKSQMATLTRGMVYIYGRASGGNVTFALLDENANVIKQFTMANSMQNYLFGFYLEKTGKYRIMAFTGHSFGVNLRVSNAPIYDSAQATLANNRWYYSGHQNQKVTVTYRFKAVSTGAMKILTDDYADITVVNGANQLLGKTQSKYYETTYGVMKGRTYLIKVSWTNMYGDVKVGGLNKIKVVNATWTSVAGKTKAAARVMPKGVWRKGLIIAGQNDIGWYKFKPGKTRFALIFTGATNDKIVYRVYCNNKHVRSTVFQQKHAARSIVFTGPKNATWYVKVERVNKMSSGRYQLRFN